MTATARVETRKGRKRDNKAASRKRVIDLHNAGRKTCAFGCLHWDADNNRCRLGIGSGGALVAEKCHLLVPSMRGPVEYFQYTVCSCGQRTTRTDGLCWRCSRKLHGKRWRATDHPGCDPRALRAPLCNQCVHWLGGCSMEFPEATNPRAAKDCACFKQEKK
jgi:hypothetical protein